ncbi:MAG: T9SS type A sorting domain-containing protein [Bacteroidetes bacterium]|nr:T9SS type A sorting domain-containing protein [Bacteroidota bacterium]
MSSGIYTFENPSIQIDQSEIRDAQYAIWIKEYDRYSISQSRFINNFVGCYFSGLSEEALTQVYSSGSFIRNWFEGVSNILPPYSTMANTTTQPSAAEVSSALQSWAGVQLDNINLITIGSSSGLPTVYSNIFKNLANGIVSRNSNLNVTRNFFFNISSSYLGYLPLSTTLFNGNGIAATGSYRDGWAFNRWMYEEGFAGYLTNNAGPPTFVNCFQGIGADNMTIEAIVNKMYNTGTGVRLSNSRNGSVRLWDNRIRASTGIISTQNSPGLIAIQQNRIEVAGTGIGWLGGHRSGITLWDYPIYSPSLPTASIMENFITLNNFAHADVSLNSVHRARCLNNTVEMNVPDFNYFGLEYNACTDLTDAYNYIYSTGTDVHFLNADLPVGIHSHYTFGSRNLTLHQCNSVKDINIGMRFSMFNNSADITGNLFNYDRDQLMADGGSNVGLFIDQDASLDPQPFMANLWHNQNDYGVNGARCNGPLVRFDVGNNDVNLMPPDVFPLFGFFFGPQNHTDDNPCEEEQMHGKREALSQYDNKVIEDSIHYNRFDEEMKWQSGKLVYQKLRESPSLIDSAVNGWQFYNEKEVGVTGMLARMDELISVALTPDSVMLEQLMALQDSIGAFLMVMRQSDSTRTRLARGALYEADSIANEELMALYGWVWPYTEGAPNMDSLLLDSLMSYLISDTSTPEAPDTTALSLLNSQIYFADSLIWAYTHSYDSIKHVMDSTRNGKILEALDSNEAITPTMPIEAGYKDVNTIYLNTLARDNNAFDSTQLTRLRQLASRCPMRGGEAVFRARAMLALVVDTFYDDDAICATDTLAYSGKKGKEEPEKQQPLANEKDAEEELKVALYPNPAMDFAFIQLNKEVSPLQLKITDAVGKEVFNERITTSNGRYKINTSSFNSGIYLIGLYSSEGKAYSGKLSIFMK